MISSLMQGCKVTWFIPYSIQSDFPFKSMFVMHITVTYFIPEINTLRDEKLKTVDVNSY